ncbi:alpha/beta fold hydrolase [Spirosoma knui]
MTQGADVRFFEFEGGRLAYRTYGKGPATLLAFHGFGQDSQVFAPVEKSVGTLFTIYAVDLFFHGASTYSDPELLTKSSWQRLIEAFLRHLGVDQFGTIGFSLGGRFALATAEVFPDRVDQLILIAPDGITPNFWYRLATGSSLGRTLFRYVLRHLSVLSYVGVGLTRLGLLNRTVMRFAELSLGTSRQRDLVYLSWTQFRRIKPDLSAISTSLTKRSVSVRFFVGAFDRIIPPQYILPLSSRLRRVDVTILRTGHNHLIEMAAERLAQRTLNDLPQADNRHDDQTNNN